MTIKYRSLWLSLCLFALCISLPIQRLHADENAARILRTQNEYYTDAFAQLPLLDSVIDYPEVQGVGSTLSYVKSLSNKYNFPHLAFRLSERQLKELYPPLDKVTIDVGENLELWRPLTIKKTNNEFLWSSNGNQPLTLTKRTITIPWDEVVHFGANPRATPNVDVTFLVFSTPTAGAIIIPAIPPVELEPGFTLHDDQECISRIGINYIELGLSSDNRFVPYSGRTKPFPYPRPDICPAINKKHFRRRKKNDDKYFYIRMASIP